MGKRYTAGAGIELFSDRQNTSTSISFAFHRFDMAESGLLRRAPYQRFYKMNQLSLSLQQNFLFTLSDKFKLAWVMRITVLNNFRANTDYSADEKINAGLRDKRTNVFLGLIGFYTDYHPLKNIPLYINGQIFNDLSMWNRSFAKYELGRVYINGTGVSTGLKYVFK